MSTSLKAGGNWTEMSEAERDALVDEHFKSNLVGLKKRGVWWRPNGKGYTCNESEAWRLTPEQAKEYEYPHDEPTTIHQFSRPPYSTSISAAFEVVEKMRGDGFVLRIENPVMNWRVTFILGTAWIAWESDSLPEAICLAALKAKGVEV